MPIDDGSRPGGSAPEGQGPAPDVPVVTLDHVRKDFGSFTAVQNADFTIGQGEFFAMLGPSGCGKTTTLKMIAGFELPSSGRVLLDGADVSHVPPYKRNVNTVFQQYALFPHMSVFDNVAFGPRNKKTSKAEVERRVRDMLEIVRLSDYAGRRPAALSGGQQQRVALARALVNLPRALLLDEPLAALDLKLREAMQIELKRIQREVGIAFVFVTHDQHEALTMSDRIAVMNEGRVEQIGTPQDIYDRPSTLFVAGFIGSANLLPATVVERDGADATIVELRGGGRVRASGTFEWPSGGHVSVMLRPERMRVATIAPEGEALPATVTDVTFQGATLRLLARLGDDTEIATMIGADEDLPMIRPGDRIWITWQPGAPYLLGGWPLHAGATTTDVDQVESIL
jgi:spermidine/putrescine transport system ATP-binding protein